MSAITAIVTLGIAAGVALVFDPSAHQYQFTEVVPWVPQLSIFYRLGVDGISIWLVVLNAFLTVIAVLATPVTMRNANRFLGLILAMSAGLAGVFMAVDLVLFYVFWEAMLIPAYFLLWLFGEDEDQPGRAAIKFVLYTLAGSLLMLVGVIGEYVATGHRQHLRPRDPGHHPAHAGDPVRPVLRLRAGVRDQDAALPVPQLAARRLPRGADSDADHLRRRDGQGRARTASCGSRSRCSRTPCCGGTGAG